VKPYRPSQLDRYSISLANVLTLDDSLIQHVFWDCKLYEDQGATMMGILSENSKKEYPESVTELLRLEEKRFVQGVCYFLNKILIFILREKEVYEKILIVYS
jgi:hypothetical protein